jgi:Mg2+/Co2+ transporter CorB
MEENRRLINDHLHTRFPLCDGGLDRVIGWVPTKEFLAAYHAEGDVSVLRLLARKPVFQPEGVTLDKLLTTFHRERTEIVFVVDEYGGVEGIVTLQDVVDELLAGLIDPMTGGGRSAPRPRRRPNRHRAWRSPAIPHATNSPPGSAWPRGRRAPAR